MSGEALVLARDTQAELMGTSGRAWQHDIAGMCRRHPDIAKPDATVASWIVYAPYAHPFWVNYMISCVNLRPIPGIPEAKIALPGATHEVMVYALDPAHPPALNDLPRYLTPANFHGQFICDSDEGATALIRQTVQDVIDAKLNPDTDYIRCWMHRFGDSNLKDPATAGQTTIVIDPGNGAQPTAIVIPAQPGPQDMN